MLQKLPQSTGYYSADACDLSQFRELIAQPTDPRDVPGAETIVKNIPVYRGSDLSLEDPQRRYAIMAEWAKVLKDGAGVVVIKQACTDMAAIDEASNAYADIIAEEKAGSGSGADHFAAAGNNDRIWNSLQKLCLKAPDVFVRYFASPAVDAACEAWLGPNYQMTAQINLVRPGGKAQQPHRDYHLGFQTAEISATYPAHVHDLSPLMTLQGGIAHVDMPVESGPTKLLPFSQAYKPGYAAWRREDFRQCFEENFVQLPLEKGDAIFFNPALFHAAGDNVSADIARMVNLLQISSAFGRAMESIDRTAMCRAVFPVLKSAWQADGLSRAQLDAVLASTAEGYSFPTNLDRDPPVGGLAPKTQKEAMKEAVISGISENDFHEELAAMDARRMP